MMKASWSSVVFDIENRFGEQEDNYKQFAKAKDLIEQKDYHLEELKNINKELRKLGIKEGTKR